MARYEAGGLGFGGLVDSSELPLMLSPNAGPSASLQNRSCLLRSRIQRANGTLGSMMCEPNLTMGSNLSLQDAVAVSELRWRNTLLTRVVF